MAMLFIITLLLFSFTLLLLMKMTVFNFKYTIKILDKNDYYQVLYDSIKEEMQYYTLQSGFGDDIIDDTFTKEEVIVSINDVIKKVYSGDKIEINTTKFEERLNKKIDDYVLEKDFKIVNKDELHQFTTEMSKVYVKKITMNGYISKINRYINKISNLVSKVTILVSILLLLCLGFYIIVFKFKKLGIALFANTLLLITLNIWFKWVIPVNSIFIYNNFISSIIKSIINNILIYIIVIAGCYFILGMMTIMLKEKKK